MSNSRDYEDHLVTLLPEGVAWPKEENTNLRKVLSGISVELERVDGRACDAIEESDPRTTYELLEDWERTVGLPDKCSESIEQTLQVRRNAVVAKLNSRGGQSKEFYIDLAKSNDIDITITEPFPFRAGRNSAGDLLYGIEWLHHWIVNTGDFIGYEFRAGQSIASERLRVLANDYLECIIERVKPAHTVVIFNFDENFEAP